MTFAFCSPSLEMAIVSLATSKNTTTAPKANKKHGRGKLATATRIIYNAMIGLLMVAITV